MTSPDTCVPIASLVLDEATPISKLLDLFSDCCLTPILSGLIVVDIYPEMVPWGSISYQSLTLCLVDELQDPTVFESLFQAAIKDTTKTLEIYDHKEALVAEVREGYISEYINYVEVSAAYGSNYRTYYPKGEKFFRGIEDTHPFCLSPINYPDPKSYKALWIRGQWGEEKAPIIKLSMYPNLESIRADCLMDISSERLLKLPKLKELGPMIITYPDTDPGMDDYFDHPTLQRINIQASLDHEVQWALKQKYLITLYCKRSLIPLYKKRYGKEPKIVGFQAL